MFHNYTNITIFKSVLLITLKPRYMKKLLLVAFALAMLFTVKGFASDPNLFSYDKNKVEAVMTDLNQLENYVLENGVTLSQMEQNGSFESANLVKVSPLNGTGDYGEPPLGIPAFWWGCIFGVVGLALVYFIAEDSEQTKKALYGCIVSGVVTIVFYVLYFVVLGSSYWW